MRSGVQSADFAPIIHVEGLASHVGFRFCVHPLRFDNICGAPEPQLKINCATVYVTYTCGMCTQVYVRRHAHACGHPVLHKDIHMHREREREIVSQRCRASFTCECREQA